MGSEMKHVRNGMGCVRPYLYGRLDLIEFAKGALGAVELERNTVPGGLHVQARIGDSVVVLVGMEPPYEHATRASIYVYVEDVDAAYARAVAAGAEGTHPPEDKPYQERSAAVKDSFGNIWYLSTYTG